MSNPTEPSRSAPSPLQRELRHIWRKLSGARARAVRAAARDFNRVLAGLGAGDVVIDLGANAGEFTLPMAQSGARVYAFEPDPHAAELLRDTVQGFDNVEVIEAAAGTEDGHATLYRKKGFAREPDRATKSSSLFAEKSNVSAADAVRIEIRDFPAFLAALNSDIALIKMDIEGAEVPLMEALLAAPVAARIGDIFVETHERKLPELAARTDALRAAAAARGAPRVNWDWR